MSACSPFILDRTTAPIVLATFFTFPKICPGMFWKNNITPIVNIINKITTTIVITVGNFIATFVATFAPEPPVILFSVFWAFFTSSAFPFALSMFCIALWGLFLDFSSSLFISSCKSELFWLSANTFHLFSL